MAITQIISSAPPAPLATDVGTPAFDEKAFPLIEWWGTNSEEFNNYKKQMNETEVHIESMESGVNANLIEIKQKNKEAIDARDEAIAAKEFIDNYVMPTEATYSPTTIDAKLDMAETLNLTGAI